MDTFDSILKNNMENLIYICRNIVSDLIIYFTNDGPM